MRSVRHLALAMLIASAACDQAPIAPEADAGVAVAPQIGFTNAGAKTLLGGLNVWAYCNAQGYPTVGYKRGWIEGPRYAYNNWVCQTGPDQLDPTNPHPINMTAACQWQYDTKSVQAHPDDPDHAWSWECFSGSYTIAGPRDNVIQANRATDNAWGDLLTENPTPMNTWKTNSFGVANQPWIN